MNAANDELKGRLASLEEKLNLLTAQVEELSARMAVNAPAPAVAVQPAPPLDPAFASREEVLTWVGRKALLPRLAAVCFVLVAALVLRTITDSNLVSAQGGSILGIIYAFSLLAWGGRLYAKSSRLAPVFPICGLLLLFLIVFETHTRFQTLPAGWVYAILVAAIGAATALGVRYKAAGALGLGIIGASLAALLIDFPRPVFPLVGVVLFTANLAAFLAYRRQRRSSLRWFALLFALLFWLFWSFKLNTTFTRGLPQSAAQLGHLWVLPILVIFWVMYFIIASLEAFNHEGPLGLFEGLLPALNSGGAFLVGRAVFGPWLANDSWLGLVAVLLGAGHFGMAAWLASQAKAGAAGVNAFGLAGTILVVLGLPAVTDSLVLSLVFWALLAFGLALFSGRWQNGGLRVTSYLLQALTCGVAVGAGILRVEATSPLAAGGAAAILSVLAILHYRWCRRHKPVTQNSGYFTWLDKGDLSAVVLLMAGLISAFFLLRTGLYQILAGAVIDLDNPLRGGQTVLINLGAALLMFIGSRQKNTEMIAVAVGVAGLGALKVFAFDLFRAEGVPLVLSVFSFGLVAAAASVVLGSGKR